MIRSWWSWWWWFLLWFRLLWFSLTTCSKSGKKADELESIGRDAYVAWSRYRRLPGGTEEVHEQTQEEGVTAEVRTGLSLNTSVEYYRIALFVVLMTMMIIIATTGIAITKWVICSTIVWVTTRGVDWWVGFYLSGHILTLSSGLSYPSSCLQHVAKTNKTTEWTLPSWEPRIL